MFACSALITVLLQKQDTTYVILTLKPIKITRQLILFKMSIYYRFLLDLATTKMTLWL